MPKDAPAVDPVAALFQEFAPGEGRTVTIGINVPPSIAARLRRCGNRARSVSDVLTKSLDVQHLRALLTQDSAAETPSPPISATP